MKPPSCWDYSFIFSHYNAQELFTGCVPLRIIAVITVLIPFSRLPVFPVAVVSEWKPEPACFLRACLGISLKHISGHCHG